MQKNDAAFHDKFHEVIKAVDVANPVTKFSMTIPKMNSVVKSNLVEIELPEEVFRFELSFEPNEKVWQTLRELTENTHVVAVPHKGAVWALGSNAEINAIFESRLKGKVSRVSTSDINIFKETALYNLMLSALLDLFAQKHALETDRRSLLWDRKSTTQTLINNVVYFTHEAVRLSFCTDGNRTYLSIQPDFNISVDVSGKEIGKEIFFEIGKGYFKEKRNSQYNDYIDRWRSKLLTKSGRGSVEFDYPANNHSGFWYKIQTAPVYAGIHNNESMLSLPSDFPVELLKKTGVKYSEPDLVFAPKYNGMIQIPKDFHPMRGISKHRPYDIDSLPATLDNTIQLGVICPSTDSTRFSKFLQQHKSRIETRGINAAYLLPFPGFADAFSTNINIPIPGSDNWKDCEDLGKTISIEEGARQLRNNITSKIQSLTADGAKRVIVLFIPDRWLEFTKYDIQNEHYDLHDFIKAYCAERQIATQFIREKTISSDLQCQINWWLSLSYFVKSMRTPWVLDSLDSQTAFAGIGYSVTHKTENTEIVLGCSHIYNSQGQGLKYRLSKITDDLIWIRKNPHLSYNDAYKLGISTVNLFYNTMNEFPSRVVIHKRTLFTKEEINGLKDSLLNAGVNELDLVEINFDDSFRFLASRVDKNKSKLVIDGYGVDRGTCILLNDFEALLWTHGVVQSVLGAGQKFYLGGRYIPAPLRIRKHYGGGNISQIATEILGLTKMNWNSFDLYSQLPATVNSSNAIARIGKLLSKNQSGGSVT